jgi:peptidyl-tRNA hydrolase
MSAPVMYILVNDDLHMSTGKIASQVAHAACDVVIRIITDVFETVKHDIRIVEYFRWLPEPTKIVLRATEQQIRAVMDDFDVSDIAVIVDDGKTEVPPDSLTAIAIRPSVAFRERMSEFKLL